MAEESEIDLALAKAVVYQTLAEGFAPPTRSAIERIAGAEREITRAASLIDAAQGAALGEAADRIPSHPSLDELREKYMRLFGHTARGEVPPYETEYGEDDIFRQPNEMADIAGFFRAFAMEAGDDVRQRCDHVSRECAFMSWLSLRHAYALTHRQEAMLSEVSRGRRLFLRDHLGRFGRAFGHRLVDADAEGFYGALGALLERLVAAECEIEKVSAGPIYLKLRDPSSAEVPMACGESCEAAENGPASHLTGNR